MGIVGRTWVASSSVVSSAEEVETRIKHLIQVATNEGEPQLIQDAAEFLKLARELTKKARCLVSRLEQ